MKLNTYIRPKCKTKHTKKVELAIEMISINEMFSEKKNVIFPPQQTKNKQQQQIPNLSPQYSQQINQINSMQK